MGCAVLCTTVNYDHRDIRAAAIEDVLLGDCQSQDMQCMYPLACCLAWRESVFDIYCLSLIGIYILTDEFGALINIPTYQ